MFVDGKAAGAAMRRVLESMQAYEARIRETLHACERDAEGIAEREHAFRKAMEAYSTTHPCTLGEATRHWIGIYERMVQQGVEHDVAFAQMMRQAAL